LPITKGIEKAIELRKYPSIKAAEEDDEDLDTSGLFIGPIAEQYLDNLPVNRK